jgi:DNA-binding beta-propeller fold protein YncE
MIGRHQGDYPMRQTRLSTFSILILSALALWAGCQDPESGTSTPTTNSSIDSTTDTDTSTARKCRGKAASITLGSAQTLTVMAEVPDQCRLFGIDASSTYAYVVDTHNDELLTAVQLDTAPSDLTLSVDGTYIVVALPNAQALIQIDSQNGEILKRVDTTAVPFKIARGPGHLVYFVEQTGFSAIHSYDLRTATETKLTGTIYYEPALQSSSDGNVLFVGEANQSGSEMTKLDGASSNLANLDLFSFKGDYGQPTPERELLLSEANQRIYYNGRAIDTTNLDRVHGWLGVQPIAVSSKGDMVASESGLHDAQLFLKFANRLVPKGGALFSADGEWFYEFDHVGSQLKKTPLVTLVGVHQLGRTQVPAGTLSQHSLSHLIVDPDPAKKLIYGLDTQQNQIVFIDTDSLLPTRAEVVGSAPTDMALHPTQRQLAIATFGATQIVLLDLDNSAKLVTSTLWVPTHPFHLSYAADGRIAYAEQDGLGDLHVVDSTTGVLGGNLSQALYQPDIAFDAGADYLLAGESAKEEAKLYKIPMGSVPFDFPQALSTQDVQSYPSRRLIVNDNSVYFGGSRYTLNDLQKTGVFNDDIITVSPDDKYAISRTHIYATDCFCEIGGLQVDSGVLAVDSQSQKVYQFDPASGGLFVVNLP